MSITVEAFNKRVRAITNDPDGVRWDDDELLDWLNDAQRAIVFYLPEAYSQVRDIPIPGGNTNYLVPEDAIRLLSVVCNVFAPDGEGEEDQLYDALDLADRQMLATAQPKWSQSASRAREHIDNIYNTQVEPDTSKYIINYTQYLYDERTPKQFWLIADPTSPIKIGDGDIPGEPQLRVTASVEPPPAMVGGNITLDDIYINPLLNFALHRCYLKEAPFANSREWADYYYDLFRREVVDKHDVNNPLTPYWDRSRRAGARPPSANPDQGAPP